MIVRMIAARTTILSTASGFLKSLRMPSLKKDVLSLMTSCCRFSSSVALSNFERSIWALRICFLGVLLGSKFQSNLMRGSTSLYKRSQIRFATTISVARKMVVAMIMV